MFGSFAWREWSCLWKRLRSHMLDHLCDTRLGLSEIPKTREVVDQRVHSDEYRLALKPTELLFYIGLSIALHAVTVSDD